MGRIKAPHAYHEPKTHDEESVCPKCGETTAKVCGWCGICVDCHTGMTKEKDF